MKLTAVCLMKPRASPTAVGLVCRHLLLRPLGPEVFTDTARFPVVVQKSYKVVYHEVLDFLPYIKSIP